MADDTATDVYLGLKALATDIPDLMGGAPSTGEPPEMWLGRASALLDRVLPMADMAFFNVAAADLGSILHASNVQTIRTIFFRGLAIAESRAPVGAWGAFIAVNSQVDGFMSIQRAVQTAKTEALLVDPYMDAKITDFARAVPDGVAVRLLTSDRHVRPDLVPALAGWPKQFPTRKIEARVAPARLLHDRAIIVDGREAWLLSQSFKDLAARSPATLQKLEPDAAAMKIAFYDDAWRQASPAT